MAVIGISVGVSAGLGLCIGLFLVAASKYFAIDKDPMVEEVLAVLPGTDCGACGYSGCRNLAEGFVANPNIEAFCLMGGEEVNAKIAEVLGIDLRPREKKTARVLCGGTLERASHLGVYQGIIDCCAAEAIACASKVCMYGCLGMGTCVKACQFDAIRIVNGVARIDEGKCVGCGACAEACPRGCIEIQSTSQRVWVACRSMDKGAIVRKECMSGCIGCRICEKNCPTGAIKVTDFLAHISADSCHECGECVRQCPVGAIRMSQKD